MKKVLNAFDEHYIPYLNDTTNALNRMVNVRYAITLQEKVMLPKNAMIECAD